MSSDSEKTARLNELLDAAWREYRGEIGERIGAVREAASLARKGELTEEARALANSAAHKLAGVLGTFGLKEASRAAIQIEKLLLPGARFASAEIAAFEAHMRLIDQAVDQKNSSL